MKSGTEGNRHHSAIKIDFKGGHKFWFDISGAQFGFHDPVLPWKDFEKNHIQDGVLVNPLDTTLQARALMIAIAPWFFNTRKAGADAIQTNPMRHIANEELSFQEFLILEETKSQEVYADTISYAWGRMFQGGHLKLLEAQFGYKFAPVL